MRELDGTGLVFMPLPAISRSFILAMSLHIIGAIVLVLAIRYWPAVPAVLPLTNLELDLAPPPSLAPGVAGPAGLDRILMSVSPEVRQEAIPLASIPEVQPAEIPEPAIAGMVAPDRPNWRSESIQMPLENLRPLSIAPSQGLERGGRPISLSGIQPHYPYAARIRGEAGKVTICLRVTPQGEVESAAVKTSSGFPALDESALATARKARFKPAEQDGQAVSADMDLQFDFRLQD
jgi:periplasmic protein TonB